MLSGLNWALWDFIGIELDFMFFLLKGYMKGIL